jgi:hypothetical protein
MSEVVKIELKGLTAYGEDVSRLGADKASNLFIDNNGYLRGRGGLKRITTSGASLPNQKVDGLFYWTSKDLTMIVSGGSLYKMNANNIVTLIGTGLSVNERASFAVVRTNQGVEALAVCNVSDIHIYDPQNATWQNIYLVDSDTPRAVKSIVYLDGYLIAIPTNSNQFYFSQVGDPSDWSSLSFASAESNSDIIENMIVKGQYLYLWGTDSLELWYDDGVTPFIRLAGAVIENGTASPYTVTKVEDFLFFLDNKRRICVVEGQSAYKVISQSIDRYLQSLDSIEDAYSFPIIHQGRVFYCINFPTTTRTEWDASAQLGITFVYDIYNQQFFEWSNWTGSEYGRLPINAECYCSLQQRQIVGKTSGGLLFELDQDTYQDDGQTLKITYETPFLDHGIQNKKRVRKMRWKATSGTSVIPTVFQFNKRFNGGSEWNLVTPLSLQVGNSSLNQHHIQLNSVGMYRTAQYQFSSTSNSPFCMGELVVEMDLMLS